MLGNLRFTSLGSGSKGNALVIESQETTLLVDCGFSCKETTRRLEKKGVDPSFLDAILVTHEHRDHIFGVGRLSSELRVPVFLTSGTYKAIKNKLAFSNLVKIDNYSEFEIGDFSIQPFPVPHDAREPAQFIFSAGSSTLGILTDLGSSTKYLEGLVAKCDGLVIECNHDVNMLRQSSYPAHLKRRVGGPLGHLSNEEASKILKRISSRRLKNVVGAHLSESNNTPELVLESLESANKSGTFSVEVADQANGFDWIEL